MGDSKTLDDNHSDETTLATELNEPCYKVYKRRWFLLATLWVLNLSNALAWLSFGPVAYNSATFYHTNLKTINWLSIVYMVIGVPCGILATWTIDTIGLRFSVILGAWLNAVGCMIRIISAVDGIIPSAKLPLVFLGQCSAAFAGPFLLFSPTKLAALWFREDQRAVANMLATIANPLGLMFCNILSPILLTTPGKMLYMLSIESIPALLAVLMATFGWWSSSPPTPPSPSAATKSENFFQGLKSLSRNWMYLLLVATVGAGIALFSSLVTLLFQILCPWGYNTYYAGVVCGGVLIGAGFIGSGIGGAIVDKTKRFTEVTKIGFALAICALVAFAILHNRTHQWAAIAVVCGIFGFFGIPVYPIGNELAVEATYPVGEATSSGMIFISGQLQGVILILVMQSIATKLQISELKHQQCTSSNHGSSTPVYDMSIPVYVMVAYGGCVCILYLIFFRTKYHRLSAEADSPKTGNRNNESDPLASETTPLTIKNN